MKLLRFLMVFMLSLMLVGCSASDQNSDRNSSNSGSSSSSTSQESSSNQQVGITLDNLPEFQGEDDPFVAINDNQPNFDEKDKNTKSFETYSYMSDGKRAGVAYANIGKDLMPKDNRESISSVTPTGWVNKKYDIVSGGYLYNRCHLIGYQLTGEGKETPENLITGTRYLNIDGMLPFENMVADYVKETGNHVLYRVTPIYDGNDLVAKGVQMEGYSVEDEGEGIMFNVFVYNVQPGIEIDYATGDSWLSKGGNNTTTNQSNQGTTGSTNNGNISSTDTKVDASQSTNSSNSNTNNNTNSNSSQNSGVIRGNSKSKIYHCPGQSKYEEMADSENLVIFHSEQDAINAGYRKAKR
ncbi:DNA/RNA non-specific endonuclease [Intestinibacter sp.]